MAQLEAMIRHFNLHGIIFHADKILERHLVFFFLLISLQSHWRAAERKHHARAVTTAGTQSMTTTSRSCHNTITINEYLGKRLKSVVCQIII